MTSATRAPGRAHDTPRLPGTWRVGLSRGVLELREFLRERDQVLFTFSLPVILLVLFAAIFDAPAGFGVTNAQLYVGGLMSAGLMSISFQNLGISVTLDRDQGRLRRLRATPMPMAAYFVGKTWMVLILGLAEVAIVLALGVGLYDLDLPSDIGTWLTFGWVFLLGLVACALLGIVVGGLAGTSRSAQSVTVLPLIALQFVSGVFIPVRELPDWLVDIGSVFPLKWMAQGLRGVFLPDRARVLEAAGTWDYDKVALVLGAWCVAGLVLCLVTFRWKGRDDG